MGRSDPFTPDRIGLVGTDDTGVRFVVVGFTPMDRSLWREGDDRDAPCFVMILKSDPMGPGAPSSTDPRTEGCMAHFSELTRPCRWEDGVFEQRRYDVWSGQQGCNTPGLPSLGHSIVVDNGGNNGVLFFPTWSQAAAMARDLNNGADHPAEKTPMSKEDPRRSMTYQEDK